MTEPTTERLDVRGGVLTYDVRPNDSRSHPFLVLAGSPMDAEGFAALADNLADRTVVTYDPLGVGRSARSDGATASTPDEHAESLRRLLTALDAGPVDFFGSSGGAVNGLALVARHGELVRTLVAHEPPLAQFLPDRAEVLAASADIRDTYERAGFGRAMAKFIAFVSRQGPIPADYAARPALDPAIFGLPTEDNGSRDNPLLGPHMVWVTQYEVDVDALRAASTRIVIAVGAESAQAMPGRAAIGLAQLLGTTRVVFPGDHGGFGPAGPNDVERPAEFAAILRDVLDSGG